MRVPTFGLAAVKDVEALVTIDCDGPTPWKPQAFEEEIRHEPPTLFVLRSLGSITAFVVARIQPPDLDIVNLAVAKDHRRTGLGRQLVRSLQEYARPLAVRSMFLEVRESNLAARGFYLNLGFGETQRRRSFYRDPVEDAVLMSLRIEP